ncbi:hypothetical protein IT407_03200 [Candidatus Uhrbacteria bacterium]|nr:hypothetical protein [Candidatus Uhrbacteria bacterium]
MHALKGHVSILELDIGEFKKTGQGEYDIQLTKEDVLGHLNYLYDGLPDVELSIKKAKEIMGEYFLGAERFEEIFETTVETESMGRIPFTIAELKKAKEQNMFLMLRADTAEPGDPIPSAAHTVYDELGVTFPRDHQIEWMQPVERAWVLVSTGSSQEMPLYLNLESSWNRARKIIGEIETSDQFPTPAEFVERNLARIEEIFDKGDKKVAAGLLHDSIANTSSEESRFLVRGNELLYDALMICGRDVKDLAMYLKNRIVGMERNKDNQPKFVKIYLDENTKSVMYSHHEIDEKWPKMANQIRV